MRIRVTSIILGIVFLAGCGGSSGSGSAAVKADAKVDASASAVFDSKACQDAVAGMAKVTSALPAAMTGKGADLESAVKQFDKFAGAAPKEIRADVKVLADAFGEAAQVIADIHFDPSSGKAPSAEQMRKLQSIGASLDTKETKAASDRVSAYFEKTCGSTP